MTDTPQEPQAPMSDAFDSVAEEISHAVHADFEQGASGQSYSPKQVRRARELLTRLYAVRRSVRFYPIDHPAVAEGIRAILKVIEQYHEEGAEVNLAFYEGEIFLGDHLLAEESVLFDQLVRDMTAIGVGSLIARKGLTNDELVRGISVVSADAPEIEKQGGLDAMLKRAELSHFLVGEIKLLERSDSGGTPTEGTAKEAYGSALQLMREMDRLVRANRAVSSAKVKGVVRGLVDNVLQNRYAMLQLTGLKNYDEYTFYHSANVAILALALGSMITTDYRFLSSLGVGAILHDIGKLTVDLHILNKPGALAPEEWALVRQHPIHGAEMAALMPGLDKSAIVVILEHHMRYDAQGYPQTTPRRPQHLTSRIVAVCDAYDAMTSRRAYSAARVQDEAMTLLLSSAGSSLDPTLVRLFVRLLGLYPPRSIVSLSDGSVAIVLRPSAADPVRPIVRVVTDPGGSVIDPFDLDLSEAEAGMHISACLNGDDVNIEPDDFL